MHELFCAAYFFGWARSERARRTTWHFCIHRAPHCARGRRLGRMPEQGRIGPQFFFKSRVTPIASYTDPMPPKRKSTGAADAEKSPKKAAAEGSPKKATGGSSKKAVVGKPCPDLEFILENEKTTTLKELTKSKVRFASVGLPCPLVSLTLDGRCSSAAGRCDLHVSTCQHSRMYQASLWVPRLDERIRGCWVRHLRTVV